MSLLLKPSQVTPDSPVGGKARSLASLAQARLPIPGWFVVLPAAFDLSLGAEQRTQLLAAQSAEDVAAVLQDLHPSAEVARQIEAAYTTLCPHDEPVAVRSSAADEDSDALSFAGQLECFRCRVQQRPGFRSSQRSSGGRRLGAGPGAGFRRGGCRYVARGARRYRARTEHRPTADCLPTGSRAAGRGDDDTGSRRLDRQSHTHGRTSCGCGAACPGYRAPLRTTPGYRMDPGGEYVVFAAEPANHDAGR